jgi:hypothetical protein
MGCDVRFSKEAAIAAGAVEYTKDIEDGYDPVRDTVVYASYQCITIAGWSCHISHSGDVMVRAKPEVLEWLREKGIPYEYC